MKKATVNYLKAIHFKVMNDQMTRNECLFLAAILFGMSLMIIHIGNTIYR